MKIGDMPVLNEDTKGVSHFETVKLLQSLDDQDIHAPQNSRQLSDLSPQIPDCPPDAYAICLPSHLI